MPVLTAQVLSALTIATTAGLISMRKEDLDPSRALEHIKAALENTEIEPDSHEVIMQVVKEAEDSTPKLT